MEEFSFHRKVMTSKPWCNTTKLVITCVLTSMCSISCVILMWISLGKVEEIRRELISLSYEITLRNNTDDPSIGALKDTEEYVDVNSEQEQTIPPNRNEICRLFGCRSSKPITRTLNNKENFIPLDTAIQQPTAVHYIPISVKDRRIRNHFGNNARCIKKWNGTICRNNTYQNNVANSIIEFWEKAPWARIHPTDVLLLGTNATNPGIFRIETEGLYLLYLNVLISATHSKHDVGIFISENKKLVCRENLDIIRGSSSVSVNAKAKTCSVSGVFYIEQNKTVSVRIVTKGTSIYLDSYNTNFGSVLLA